MGYICNSFHYSTIQCKTNEIYIISFQKHNKIITYYYHIHFGFNSKLWSKHDVNTWPLDKLKWRISRHKKQHDEQQQAVWAENHNFFRSAASLTRVYGIRTGNWAKPNELVLLCHWTDDSRQPGCFIGSRGKMTMEIRWPTKMLVNTVTDKVLASNFHMQSFHTFKLNLGSSCVLSHG